MRFLTILSVALLACSAAMAQTPAAPPAPVSFDQSAMDLKADPCQDFYQYACGGWRSSHPIPADKARYGRFDELREYNLYLLHSILEDTAKPGKHTPSEKKVGNFYAACMDEEAIEAKGIQPIEGWLNKVAAIKSKRQVLDLVAKSRRTDCVLSSTLGRGRICIIRQPTLPMWTRAD